MSTTDLVISPLSPALGAEITGIDLEQSLGDATLEVVYKALIEHKVVFFRERAVSPQRHLRCAESFAELDKPHAVYTHVPGYARIVLLQNDADIPPDTDGWHSDLSFKDEPPFASILAAREVPACGGDTMWANMAAAYKALPEEIKTLLSSLRAVHDMGDYLPARRCMNCIPVVRDSRANSVLCAAS